MPFSVNGWAFVIVFHVHRHKGVRQGISDHLLPVGGHLNRRSWLNESRVAEIRRCVVEINRGRPGTVDDSQWTVEMTRPVFAIVNRTGTTTIYLNNASSDFSNPASFSQGTPIQVSTYRQQVIANTLTNAFVTVHMNTNYKTPSHSH